MVQVLGRHWVRFDRGPSLLDALLDVRRIRQGRVVGARDAAQVGSRVDDDAARGEERVYM